MAISKEVIEAPAVGKDAADQSELRKLLDPDRDYGERTFEDVLEGLDSGELYLLPGKRLPMIRRSDTNMGIKGTGVPPLAGSSPVQTMRAEFNIRAMEDFDTVYNSLIKACKQGDARAMKLFLDKFFGRDEVGKNDVRNEILEKLLELASNPRVREVADLTIPEYDPS